MTDEFKQLTDELAQGFNFSKNGIVFCVAVDNSETGNYDLTLHFDGNNYAVKAIVEFIVKQYLEPLPDDMAKLYGDSLIDIIHKDRENRSVKK